MKIYLVNEWVTDSHSVKYSNWETQLILLDTKLTEEVRAVLLEVNGIFWFQSTQNFMVIYPIAFQYCHLHPYNHSAR